MVVMVMEVLAGPGDGAGLGVVVVLAVDEGSWGRVKWL
jgi:hypothetical protein